jgi:Ca2+-binding EF-hand superfamily protein
MRGAPPNSGEMAAHILEEEDSDGDGKLSVSESRMSSNLFKEIDADDDGLLTTDELEAGFEAKRAEHAARMAIRMIEEEDTDGDGMISLEETRLSEDLFGEIDSDEDGLLSTEELQESFESMGPPPPPPDGGQTQGLESNLALDSSEVTSLLEILNQNEASNAYDSQNWFASLLESTASSFVQSV